MRLLAIAGLAVVSVLSLATTSFAQDEDSHWGVVVHYTPEWKVAEGIFEELFEGGKPNKLTGNEFQIGIARGRMQSGDWGATLVRRKVNPGSTTGELCLTPFTGCGDVNGDKYTYNDVMLTGFEVHKFVPFVTIARRVQIGINFSGGLGVYSGTVTKQEFEVTNFQTGAGRIETEQIDAKDAFAMNKVPMGKLELAVAGIVGKGVKVRAGYGMDFPGYPVFSISGIYLFGSE